MKIKIENLVERTTFPSPQKRVVVVDVFYSTEKGYHGMITREKEGLTDERIKAAVKGAAEAPNRMI